MVFVVLFIRNFENKKKRENLMKKERGLVTGGLGFIGSHVAERYLSLGHSVVIVDDLSTGFERNIPPEQSSIRPTLRLMILNLFFRVKALTSLTTWLLRLACVIRWRILSMMPKRI